MSTLRATSPERRLFLGDQAEDSNIFLVGLILRDLALIKRLLREGCRPRRREPRPDLPLEYVNDIWAGDAQPEAGLSVPVIKLVGFVPPNGFTPLNALLKVLIRVEIAHVSAELVARFSRT